MVKVYFFHSGWLSAVDPLGPLRGAAASDVEAQPTRVLPRASRPTVVTIREVLLGMASHVPSVLWWEGSRDVLDEVGRGSSRSWTASVLVGQTEVLQERGAQLLSRDSRLAVRGRQL